MNYTSYNVIQRNASSVSVDEQGEIVPGTRFFRRRPPGQNSGGTSLSAGS